MLDYYGLDYNLDEVRSWYDGYTIGKQQHVYNPWSINSFVKNNGKIAPYWVNTSENLLIQDLIKTAGSETKMDFEDIVAGKSVQKEIIDGLVFQKLATQPLAVWNLLLASGYLSYKTLVSKDGRDYAELEIPNKELEYMYDTTIQEWFQWSFANAISPYAQSSGEWHAGRT